ncbi:MAG: DUF2807 domain-containing protein [bacterium]
MQEITNINGIPVYSDKEVRSIINTKVTFSDGSWCDVTTGKIVNKGGGYIHINNPDESVSKKHITEEKEFSASLLHLLNVQTKVEVKIHNDSKIKVSVTGPEAKVKKISCEISNNTLTIKDLNTNSSGGMNISGGTIITGNSFHIGNIFSRNSIISSSTTIITGNNQQGIIINIKVPQGINIKAETSNGDISIGDTEGDIELSTTAGDIKVGAVKNAILCIQGGGDITVSKVVGNLTTHLTGSGDITIKKGNVINMIASIQGSGDIKFGGKAENANLSIRGSGDIEVDFVRNKPTISIMGSGDVDVNNW